MTTLPTFISTALFKTNFTLEPWNWSNIIY